MVAGLVFWFYWNWNHNSGNGSILALSLDHPGPNVNPFVGDVMGHDFFCIVKVENLRMCEVLLTRPNIVHPTPFFMISALQ